MKWQCRRLMLSMNTEEVKQIIRLNLMLQSGTENAQPGVSLFC